MRQSVARSFAFGALTLAAACVWTGAAFAQTPPPAADAAKAVAGAWELSNADRDRTCTLTLRGTAAAPGLGLQWDAKCAALFPFSREIVAWTITAGDALQLLDRSGKPILELSEVEGGLYEGERPGEGLLFLQNVAAGGGATGRTAEEMTGDWAFTRGAGKAICQITLASTPLRADTMTLRVKPGCDATITRFGPVAWQMDRGQLVLSSKGGEAWQFEETEPMNWRRIPEARQPLVLVKQ
jgi:hypothetical protein